MRRQRVNIMEIDVLGWTFHLDYLRDLFLAYLLAFPVAFHRFEVAVLLTFLNFFTLLVFKPIKSLIRRKHRVRIRGSDSDEDRSG
jgi:hypothetical protein